MTYSILVSRPWNTRGGKIVPYVYESSLILRPTKTHQITMTAVGFTVLWKCVCVCGGGGGGGGWRVRNLTLWQICGGGGRGFRWNKTADYWSADKQELPYESTVLPLCLAALVSHLRRASIPLKFVSPVPEVWYTAVISLFHVQDDEADRQTLWYPHFRTKENDKDPQ